MESHKCILYVVVLWNLVGLAMLADSTCPAKFRDYRSTHTACLAPQEGSDKPTNEGVSAADKTLIVDLHNKYRSTVHQYNNQPEATNMQKMYWDDELAMIAQKWASNCNWGHDENLNRAVPKSYSVGQNLALGQSTWKGAIDDWQAEVDYLKFGESKTAGKDVGHYTQIVWADSARVGCGYAACNGLGNHYVCNYAKAGNSGSSKYTPYTSGSSASSCPQSTTPGLCDCGGKVCKNGGTLNLQTCECSCLDKPWIQQGGECDMDCSQAKDSSICATNGGSWDKSYCRFSNIPYQYCPVMCNWCPAEGSSATSALSTNPPVKTTASTKTTQAPSGLPVCKKPVEAAKCGQPGPSYYPKSFCSYSSVSEACHGMCKKDCKITSCLDHDGGSHDVGETWNTPYGQMTCTEQGVTVTEGCYLSQAGAFILVGENHTYVNGNIQMTCTCTAPRSYSCTGKYV